MEHVLSLYIKASSQLFDCLDNLYLQDQVSQVTADTYWSGVKSYLYSMIMTCRNFQNATVEIRVMNSKDPTAQPEITTAKLKDMEVGKKMAIIMQVPFIVRTEGHA